MTEFRQSIGFGGEPRAAYASDPMRSLGRLHVEPTSPTRTPFQRDRDRIIHSAGFRRLAYKTQVFIVHEGDHYRSRLTHTIEVSQIARALARALRLDEDLAEALALGHDLGHTPFGHAGERAMQAVMADYDGFDHNGQTLRLVTRLEQRYAEFDGLNLSWETLEGLVKHNGPLLDGSGKVIARHGASKPGGKAEPAALPYAIRVHQQEQDLALDRQSSLEAQVAGLADDIAYDAHDLDDGLRAGLITVDELAGVPMLAGLIDEVRGRYAALDDIRLAQEVTRRLITRMVEDVIGETLRRIGTTRPASVDDVRLMPQPLASFSEAMAENDRAIKAFLFARVYRSRSVMAVMTSAEGVVRDLFSAYFSGAAELPEDWRRGMDACDEAIRARRICDYIAGMTDRFALSDHARLFDHTPELR